MPSIFNLKKTKPTVYTPPRELTLREELILCFNWQSHDNLWADNQEKWYQNRIIDEILERHWLPRTKEIVSCWMSFLEISPDWAVYIWGEDWNNNFMIN